MNEEFAFFPDHIGIRTIKDPDTPYSIAYQDGASSALIYAANSKGGHVDMTRDQLREFIADLAGVLNRMNIRGAT